MNEREVVTYMKGPTVPGHTGSTVWSKVAVVLSMYQSKPALMGSFKISISPTPKVSMGVRNLGDYPAQVGKLRDGKQVCLGFLSKATAR